MWWAKSLHVNLSVNQTKMKDIAVAFAEAFAALVAVAQIATFAVTCIYLLICLLSSLLSVWLLYHDLDSDLLHLRPDLRKSASVDERHDLIASHYFRFIFHKKQSIASYRWRQTVRTVFCPVTCGSLIRRVLHNLQKINNASKRGVSRRPLSDV